MWGEVAILTSDLTTPLSPNKLLKSLDQESLIHLRRWWRWRHQPYHFLIEACWTKDEVAANPGSTETKEVVRRIPEKDFIRIAVDRWGRYDRLATPKSRRMLMSWICTCLELRLCLYWPVTIHVYAQRQQGAEAFLGRHKWLYEHLPHGFPKPKLKQWRGLKGDPNKLLFEETGALIEAFPGEPNAVRGEGCTVARLEEFAFWTWPDQSFKAILPTTLGGGKLVIVSTALAGTPYKEIVFDETGRI